MIHKELLWQTINVLHLQGACCFLQCNSNKVPTVPMLALCVSLMHVPNRWQTRIYDMYMYLNKYNPNHVSIKICLTQNTERHRIHISYPSPFLKEALKPMNVYNLKEERKHFIYSALKTIFYISHEWTLYHWATSRSTHKCQSHKNRV